MENKKTIKNFENLSSAIYAAFCNAGVDVDENPELFRCIEEEMINFIYEKGNKNART